MKRGTKASLVYLPLWVACVLVLSLTFAPRARAQSAAPKTTERTQPVERPNRLAYEVTGGLLGTVGGALVGAVGGDASGFDDRHWAELAAVGTFAAVGPTLGSIMGYELTVEMLPVGPPRRRVPAMAARGVGDAGSMGAQLLQVRLRF